MRVSVLDLHHKSAYLVHMLQEQGFELATDPDTFDFEALLVDSDHPLSPPIPLKHNIVKECVRRGIPVVIYPHGGPPDLDMDGLRKSKIPISLQLAHGEGHVEVNRRFGSNRRVEAVGWTLGPVSQGSPFPPVPGPSVESLIFAPIHPWANGKEILRPHQLLNWRAYRAFLDHPAPRKLVRMYGEDHPNGVDERVDGVEYTQSDLSAMTSLALIREFDAVVAYGTFAYMAIAEGKPTAHIYAYPPHTSDDGKVEAAHWHEYAEYTKCPVFVDDGPLQDVFKRDISGWKELFVGEQLDGERLADLLRSVRPNRKTRRALARA